MPKKQEAVKLLKSKKEQMGMTKDFESPAMEEALKKAGKIQTKPKLRKGKPEPVKLPESILEKMAAAIDFENPAMKEALEKMEENLKKRELENKFLRNLKIM